MTTNPAISSRIEILYLCIGSFSPLGVTKLYDIASLPGMRYQCSNPAFKHKQNVGQFFCIIFVSHKPDSSTSFRSKAQDRYFIDSIPWTFWRLVLAILAFTDVAVGLGHAWLLKSQVILAKIDHAEGSSSSQESENGLRRSPFRPPPTNGDTGDNGDTTRANSSDYIEARALLRPSLDFFDRAVNAGDRQQIATAELLELVSYIMVNMFMNQ